ncbi:MAG: hypothetical protein LW688_04245 [Cryomorphaceae bacterium]|jgi:hypothetical protein|nr:hypothetical protein [Cryomorphaceae bacterium]
MTTKSKTLIIIPFRFENLDFLETKIYKNKSNRDIRKFIDKSKFFDFIGKKFDTSTEGKEFLDINCLEMNSLEDSQGESFGDRYQGHQFYLDSNLSIRAEFSNLWILINSLLNIGYILFEINLHHQEVEVIENLQNQKLFRFYNLDVELKKNTERKKYSFKIAKNNEIVEYLSLHSFLISYLPELVKNERSGFSFIHSKPFQFHLISDRVTSYQDVNKKCFNILRIPSDGFVNNTNETIDSTYLNDHFKNVELTYFFASNEGAIILDPNRTIEESFSMYCPSIFMALNQRESILNLNYSVSEIIQEHRKQKISNSERLTALKKFSKDINDVRLSQFYYSISTYSEIDVFFRLLQKQMNIDILLSDINESIDGVKNILQHEEEHKNNVKRDVIGVVISIIGISGLLSFIIDASSFSSISILVFIGICLAALITFLHMYYEKIYSIFNKKNKS